MTSRMTKTQFLRSLNDVYCRLGVTTHGVGVIAIRPIPKGIDPFKNCDPDDGALRISEKELRDAKAPESAKKIVRDFCALQDGVYFVPAYSVDRLDKSYYLNHSDTPNMITKDGGEYFVTARRIKAGEELTADYRTYHESREI